MYALRRVLYAQAAAFFLSGVGLAVVPGPVLRHLFGEPVSLPGQLGWVRLAGVEAIGLSMLMVMVGHRVEELWWWSWAFVLVAAATAAVALLNAAFGLAPHQSSVLWWLVAAVNVHDRKAPVSEPAAIEVDLPLVVGSAVLEAPQDALILAGGRRAQPGSDAAHQAARLADALTS